MAKILVYLIGPAAGLLILIIGVVVGLITGSTIEPLAILRIALGVALMTEFCVVLSVMEETGKGAEEGK